MRASTLPFLLPAFALVYASPPLSRRQTSSSNGYADPRNGGGSMLTNSYNGHGEPINVIVSGESDAQVLSPAGFYNYALSLDFGEECLGLHEGGYQAANLGDGNGQHNQTGIYRENFGDQNYGTCTESINGGNHFRFWRQNGSAADTGAWFIAASVEMNATLGHNIVSDGYDRGRDNLVSRASSTGGTSNDGVSYTTSVQMVSDLLTQGSSGINHHISIDGLVAVLTVSATGSMQNSTASSGSSGSATSTTPSSTGSAWHSASLAPLILLLGSSIVLI